LSVPTGLMTVFCSSLPLPLALFMVGKLGTALKTQACLCIHTYSFIHSACRLSLALYSAGIPPGC